jgi:3-oxoacyl-[acyl-carrier protein] reductase
MMLDLTNKTAIVTGSGRGIGRAIAAKLAAAGARVMINDLDPGPCAEATAEIPNSAALAGDMTDPAFPAQLVEATLHRFGSIDIVVNNAGYTWDNVIQKTTDEQYQAMLDIHLVAPFRLLRAASSWLRETAKREAAEGRRVMRKVVNITSIAGTDGGPGQAGYGAGKAGVIGLTKVVAKEWGRYNINVNCVGFGLIETRLIQPLSAESSIEVKGRAIQIGVQPKVMDTLVGLSPLGRRGTVEEAAGPVLFFCSPLSDYITGEVLIVSGGIHF